eukprot:TRINITY_DN8329_c0_g1_i1.p1 TRINITY_DN8329_c0_g1~~TRINITY_DN8329_c0_g1_i1.p1  ORF type:complete len:178 (+),score=24.06 TRINITY_DN8329_c0_g1_i1:58-591(+)
MGFVGCEALKQQHRTQLKFFESWVSSGQWMKIHNAHFDWWMFPIDEKSASKGVKYTVSLEHVQKLKSDAEWMVAYRRGVEILLLSWGWNINHRTEVERSERDKKNGQRWQHYPVRLYKCIKSLMLFRESDYVESIKQYVTTVLKVTPEGLDPRDNDSIRVVYLLDLPEKSQYELRGG